MIIIPVRKNLDSASQALFLVEQNALRALGLADRGYVLENGRIVLADTGARLLANEDVRKAYLRGRLYPPDVEV